MESMSELERRHIEEQLGGARGELAGIKAELRSLLALARQWQQDRTEREAKDAPPS